MPKSDKDTLQLVHQSRNAGSATFKDKWDDAQENARFFRLLQYSDPQLAKLKSDNRVPYVLDYVTGAVNTMLGVQRDQRMDIAYLPVEKDDEVRTEVLNTVKDSVMRNNGFLYVESDIFQDGIIEKTGVLGYEWSTIRNPLGELRMFRIPPRQFRWDLNRRDFSLDSAQWVSRDRLRGKQELARQFPDFKKEIMSMPLSAEGLDDLGLDETYMKQILDNDLDSVAYIEFYNRTFKTRYFIVNEGNILDEYFDAKKDADRFIKDRIQRYEQIDVPKFQEMGITPPPTPMFQIRSQEFPIIQKSEIAHNIVLSNTEDTDLPDYPYDVFHPFWHDGEWWGGMDLFKDAQRFINKMFLQVDHQIGRNSKGLLLIDDVIEPAQADKIIKGWSGTGAAMQVKDPKNNVVFIPPGGFDPRLLSAMDVAIVNLEKKAGGQNFLGRQESASESGIAVKQRIEQGSLSSFIVYDNLSRWKRSVGAKIMWYLSNYMTAAQKVRIEGKELTQFAQERFPNWFESSSKNSYGFLTVNTAKENSLEGLKADVIVDEARHSVTKNQAVLQQLSVAMQSSPVIAETVDASMIIPLLDLPATEKELWLKKTEQLFQAKMQRDQAAAQKPPTISASLGDVMKLDDQAQAQFMSKFFGIQIQEGMKDRSKEEEMAIKSMADLHKQQNDIDFKQGKHDDQMLAKTLQTMSQHHLETEKLKKEKQNAVQE